MKRIRIILALALMVSAAACTVNYDEGPVNDKINDLTSQIAELEQLVAAKNAEIASVRKLFQAVETGDVITACEAYEDAYGIGYRVTFYK